MESNKLSQLLGVCLVGVVTLFLAPPLHADEQTIAFANTEAITLKWKQDGKWTGPFIDIIQEVKRRTGIDIKVIPMPGKRLLYAVETGGILAAIGTTYTKKKTKWAHFVDVPIGWLETHVYVRKDKNIDVKSIEDLYTLSVGIISGFDTYYSKAYQDALASGKIVPQELKNYESLLQFLLLDRADVIISPSVQMDVQISKIGAADKIKRLSFPIARKIPLLLMISKKNSQSHAGSVAAQKVEAALVSMQKEGSIAAIYKKYGFEFFKPK